MGWTSRYDYWGAGFPADAVFDDVEGRQAIWNGIPRALTLTVANDNYGSVAIEPDLRDPNDPNASDEKWLRYTDGTEIVMVATPIEGKAFNRWVLFDPNYPGDKNYATFDTNDTIYVTMDQDRVIEAAFKCGSSVPPFVAMTLLALGLGVVIRRLS